MKHTLITIAVTFGIAASALGDYVIEEEVQHNETPAQKMTIKLKEGKARVDMGEQMSSISANGEVKMLMHSQKEAMTLPAALSAKAKATAGSDGSLQPTGRKEKINGFDTEEYVHDNPTMKAQSHYWIAKDYPDGAEILKLMMAMQSGPAQQMAQSLGALSPSAFPGLPIRTEVESHLMGKPSKTRMTITSITKEPVDDSVFAVPAGYREAGKGGKDDE